jgi:Fe-S-cluster containining protein
LIIGQTKKILSFNDAYFCVMAELINNWEKEAIARQKNYKRFLEKPDKKMILRNQQEIHDAAMEKIDCLQCAQCCKKYSPRFKTPDIKRISKVLGMKESVFIETYLRLDQDGDYVVKSSPCPFLGSDNACSIYEDRPSDCARFPYTDEDVLYKRPALTLKNSSFCPIVYTVLEELMKRK